MGEIQKHYEDLKRSLSEEFNKKMTGWGQKKLSKESSDGRSGAGGGGGGDDRQLSAEFRKKLDEWHRREKLAGKPDIQGAGGANKIRARPAEQKKIEENDLKPEFKLKVAEWEVRKALAGHSNKTTEEITKLMPEDFNKKLKEWEQIKEGKPSPRSERASVGSTEK